MNLQTLIDLEAGGPGSGCNPAVAEPGCGRPKGAGAKADWRIANRSMGGRKHAWTLKLPDGRQAELRMILHPGMGKGKHWEVYVNGVRKFHGKVFPNALAAKKAVEKRYNIKKQEFIEDIQKQDKAKFIQDVIQRRPARDVAPRVSEERNPYRPIEREPKPLMGDSPLAVTPEKSVAKLGGGVNGSYVVELQNGMKGVWKPKDEESKLFPFLVGKMYLREALGWDVAKIVGYEDLVPETVVREVKGKVGSMMAFVHDAKVGHGYSHADLWKNGDRLQIEKGAAFDYLLGNPDRHGGNYMVSKKMNTGGVEKYKFHLIDNGFTMHPRVWEEGKDSSFADMIRDNDRDKVISSVVKDAWKNNWDKVEAAMRTRGVKEEHIKVAQRRLAKFLVADKWRNI